MIDLLNIKPHEVSRDMRGYSIFLFGDPKSGKTTAASKFPKSLILAFEKGYAALPGVMANPINSWSEFRKVLRQLKDPAVQEMYETICIDTADVAYTYCEKYVCANANVDAVDKIPYGQGWGMVAKEFDECLRLIIQLNYGLVIISHSEDKTFKNEQGEEYNKIIPTLGKKPRLIVSRLCDIIGYSRSVEVEGGRYETKLFMRGTPRYEAGSRFKYTPDYIDFSYTNLVKAIGDAIDKEAEETGNVYVTNEKVNVYTTSAELNFDSLMMLFNNDSSYLMKINPEFYGPRIVHIVDSYLGKGKKVSDANRDQVEALSLIVDELKELITEMETLEMEVETFEEIET